MTTFEGFEWKSLSVEVFEEVWMRFQILVCMCNSLEKVRKGGLIKQAIGSQ
jgi:hypothetical protein